MTSSSAAPQARYYQSQGLRLHYTDWGNASAPPLLLVHGGLDHSRSWDHVAQ
ncbi:alpha/beta fold hydrolase, partial [Bradyrhizobium sp.]|uniref:alpha/beta fold hydrolase n=1 Tax=Bradyrhizobium sp. TaxID=376 RepID=UPI0027498996|nr:alpha/beta hydrolase [Bradyrhizobium sp.]